MHVVTSLAMQNMAKYLCLIVVLCMNFYDNTALTG